MVGLAERSHSIVVGTYRQCSEEETKSITAENALGDQDISRGDVNNNFKPIKKEKKGYYDRKCRELESK